MIRTLIFSAILVISISGIAQTGKKYEAVDISNDEFYHYAIVNQNGDTIKKLDAEKYIVTLQPNFDNFLIIAIKGREGWSAINLQEEYLFQVYNRLPTEPLPDYLVEDRIRIVGENGLIGFANSLGEIVIEPKFISVTEFNKGHAIFGSDCEKVHNGQEGEHSGYVQKCKKTGYINKRGEILAVESISFEEMKNKINWESSNW